MAVPGDKMYNSCLPFGETHQKLLATILIVLGLFALLEYAVKLIALVSKMNQVGVNACPHKLDGLQGIFGLPNCGHWVSITDH